MSITVRVAECPNPLACEPTSSAAPMQAPMPASREAQHPPQPLELHADELWRAQVPHLFALCLV